MDAWCDLPFPKLFIRFFGYNSSNQLEQHPSLIGCFKKAVEEIVLAEEETTLTTEVAPPPPPKPTTKNPLIIFLAHEIPQHVAVS